MAIQSCFAVRIRPRAAIGAALILTASLGGQSANSRRPASDRELRYWLENMVSYHRFTTAEIQAATGLSTEEIERACQRFHIRPDQRPERRRDAPLLVMPYPGGRHPRIGFLEGAIDPQRETKVSVFTPWDEGSYVVADIPEAIWWNTPAGRELLYLAHTHIPTVWTKQGVVLPRLEWRRHADGTLSVERRLPNGVTFGTRVAPAREAVRMEMWLKNGTGRTLTGLRVQNCVMLGRAPEFARQTDENKVARKPYMAVRSDGGDRWVITAWEPCQRTWGNERSPCMHSDPAFPDCAPGETVRITGRLSFFEGTDIQAEFKRLDALGWSRS